MSPNAHPSDETLLRFAAGTLPLGPRLVVAAHLAACPCCRAAARAFETVGGALLEADPSSAHALGPDALAPEALAAALARLDEAAPLRAGPLRVGPGRAIRAAPRAPSGLPEGIVLPSALSGCALGPLRPVAPGVRLGRVGVPGAPEADVILLRIGPGRRIPLHTHSGAEFTQVLQGAYHDHLGHYGPGDLVEADEALDHTPVVDGDGDCICLVAMEGPLRFRGVLGMVLRPFLSAGGR